MSIGTKEAEKKAREIFAEFDFKIPVNVKNIAKKYGVDIKEKDLVDNISGMLAVRDKHAIMHINSSHHPNRKRFSMAHELGHFFLHRTMSEVFVDAFHRDIDSSKGIDPQEIQANAFAAELLMPEQLIRAKLQETPLDIFDEGAVKRLAKEFEVSSQALIIRLTRLNLVSA